MLLLSTVRRLFSDSAKLDKHLSTDCSICISCRKFFSQILDETSETRASHECYRCNCGFVSTFAEGVIACSMHCRRDYNYTWPDD